MSAFYASFPIHPSQLGPIVTKDGTSFSLLTGIDATRVDLVLIRDPHNRKDHSIMPMQAVKSDSGSVGCKGFRVFAPGVGPGWCYGFRVDGPFDPRRGLLYNWYKLLADPWMKLLGCPGMEHPSLYATTSGDIYSMDVQDSLLHAPLSMVPPDLSFDWEGTFGRVVKPASKRVILETHVCNLTRMFPEIPEEIRGTYSAVAHPCVIAKLQKLGITTIEFMPIQASLDRIGKHWGYMTLGYFAPDPRYSAFPHEPLKTILEVQTMVRELAKVGIEVILDVVYNHTIEGNHLGPSLCFRGIANDQYYHLIGNSDIGPYRFYYDLSSTGNTFNTNSPLGQLLTIASLEYWEQVMNIRGARFDLASCMFRKHSSQGHLVEFDVEHPLFELFRSHLPEHFLKIAEPWSGRYFYDLSRYPDDFYEWNDLARNGYQLAATGKNSWVDDLATRLAGSLDVLRHREHSNVSRSINSGTTHDGFTAEDRMSYNQKNNWQNKENNADGHHPDHSYNCGIEGSTTEKRVLEERARRVKQLVALSLVSAGVPMLAHTDIVAHSSGGNNNPYCQNNPVSWLEWDNPRSEWMFDFVSKLVNLRLKTPGLWSYNFGKDGSPYGWYSPTGFPMSTGEWQSPHVCGVVVYLSDQNEEHEPSEDVAEILLMVNVSPFTKTFWLPQPARRQELSWTRVMDSSLDAPYERIPIASDMSYDLGGNGVLLLLTHPPVDEEQELSSPAAIGETGTEETSPEGTDDMDEMWFMSMTPEIPEELFTEAVNS